jgi:hypothetical protein
MNLRQISDEAARNPAMGRLPSGWFGQKAEIGQGLTVFILQGRPKAGEEFIRSPRWHAAVWTLALRGRAPWLF